MGRQIPILMTPADRDLLWRRMQETGAIALAYYHPTAVLVRLDGLADLGRNPMVYLVREADVGLVRLQYIATQGYWLVDGGASPVIELSGGRAELASNCGRLYYQTGRWVGQEWIDHDRDFVIWAERLWRWVRRTFERDRELGCWAGPGAKVWPRASE